MSPVDVLRIVFAILLLFFLPGFLLVQVIFPKKYELDENEDLLYRIVLGIALSIVINILIGFVLAHPDVRAFTAENITVSILLVSGILFIAGWYRGAYPFLGRSADPVPRLPIPRRNLERAQELLEEWKLYKKKIYQIEEKIKHIDDDRVRNRLLQKRDMYLKKIKEIDTKIDFLTRVENPRGDAEEILERIQELFMEWQDLKHRATDIDIKILIAQKKGYKQKEEALWKKKEQITRKMEDLSAEIERLRQELESRGGEK